MKDAAGFDAFYTAGNRRVMHQMYAMTGNLADAQELTQKAYARAWQRWSAVSAYDDPEAWVRTVAWRLAASRWRKTRNGLTALLRHGPPEHAPEPGVDNVALVAALRRIPDAQRRAVVLHHLGGLSVAEVAHEVGAPEGTVKARLSPSRAPEERQLPSRPLPRLSRAAAEAPRPMACNSGHQPTYPSRAPTSLSTRPVHQPRCRARS